MKSYAPLLAILLTATGCSVFGGDKQAEPELGVISQVRTFEDIVLPLDSYVMTPDKQATVQRAARSLMLQCAGGFGFQPTAAMREPAAGYTREHYVDRRYGIFRVDHAQQYGYRRPPHLRLPEDKADGWQPSDEEFAVVRGKDRYTGESKEGTVINGKAVPKEGCAGEAWRRLYQGTSADVGRAEALMNNAYSQAENDSRVVAAVGAWSACMRRSGYDYPRVWDPNNKRWPEPVGQEEIATAVADTTCKQEVNLTGIWLATEVAYQKRILEHNAEELTKIKNSGEAQLRNAAAVLGS